MGRHARRATRWAAAAALTAGLVVASATAVPSAAQEAPPVTEPPTTATTVAPPTTTTPLPATPPTTTGDPAPTTTVPEAAEPDPGAPPATTATTVATPPAGPPAAAGVTLTLDLPAGALVVDGQPLGVTVTGVPDVDYVLLRQCVDGTEPPFQRCQYEDSSYEIVDDTVHATVRLDAVLPVGGFDGVPAREVDCRTTPCSVLVEYATTDGPVATVSAPLPFDPDGPLAPPPTASVAPAGPYVHGQSVTVRAAGLVWSSYASVDAVRGGRGRRDRLRHGHPAIPVPRGR